MLEAGMSIAIIKLAHCNLDQAKELIQTLRKSVMNYSMKIGRVYALGIGIDIKGPEIRTGLFKEVFNLILWFIYYKYEPHFSMILKKYN